MGLEFLAVLILIPVGIVRLTQEGRHFFQDLKATSWHQRNTLDRIEMVGTVFYALLLLSAVVIGAYAVVM